MAEIVLAAETGRVTGSSSSRRLRAAHRIPAVLYGHGIAPISLSVDSRELRTALNGEAGARALLSLQVDGQSHLAMARQLQRHPVRQTVIHIDFQVVRHDEVVSVEVPLSFVGEAIEVNRADGVIEHELQTLAVRAIPSQLPSSVEVDVSALTVGDAIRASDVALPDGVELDVDGDTVVAIAHAGLAAVEAAAAAAAETPEVEEEEGAEAAPSDEPAQDS
jgi:large subunit ribosomal protein L25